VTLQLFRNHKEMTIEVVIKPDRRSEALYPASCYTA
jgi:hypothetical protein